MGYFFCFSLNFFWGGGRLNWFVLKSLPTKIEHHSLWTTENKHSSRAMKAFFNKTRIRWTDDARLHRLQHYEVLLETEYTVCSLSSTLDLSFFFAKVGQLTLGSWREKNLNNCRIKRHETLYRELILLTYNDPAASYPVTAFPWLWFITTYL